MYTPRHKVGFLTPGVLLEMGSRGGPLPNDLLAVRSLMAAAAEEINPSAATGYRDLTSFEVVVLAPERTLAEKLAFLHHRATVADTRPLTLGARHLYDVAMLLQSDRVKDSLAVGQIVELMVDVDARSEAAGWPFTPRPEGGFATSIAFGDDAAISGALIDGYARLGQLVWGQLPAFDEAVEIIRSSAHLI